MSSRRPHPLFAVAAATTAACTALAVAGCGLDATPVAATSTAASASSPAAGKAAPLVTPNWVAEPRRFAGGAGIQFGDLALAPDRMLGATLGAAPAKLMTLDESGAAQPFAAHFAPGADVACALEFSSGIAGFADEVIYVGCGSDIWQLPPDGSAAVLLCTFADTDGAVRDLCFDTGGEYGFRLVALTAAGALHAIAPSGSSERLGDAGPGATGLAIAPAQLIPCARRILIAVPDVAEVRAHERTGGWTVVTRWSGVSGLCVIPDEPRAFGTTAGSVFLATEDATVQRFDLHDLAGRGGQVILTTQHASGSGLVVPQGTGYITRPFSRFVGREIAARAVVRPAVQRVQVDVWPGASPDVQSVVIGSNTLIPVAILSSVGFDPRILDRGELVLAGALPVPVARGRVGVFFDLNADGVADYIVRFNAGDMHLHPGACALAFEGMSMGGERVRGGDRIFVVSP